MEGLLRVAAWLCGATFAIGCSTGTGSARDWYEHPSDAAAGTVTPYVDADVAKKPVEPYGSTVAIAKPYTGFTLDGMSMVAYGNNRGYSESDFSLMHDLGFNWVRLPVDYLTYTSAVDWLAYNPDGLQKLDQGIEYGQKYGIHVCLTLYEAPGYSVAVNVDPSGLNLWKDSAAQQAFVAHWQMFAERYQKIPGEFLSFNLVNEPPNLPSVYDPATTPSVDESTYISVMQSAIQAIRSITPSRPVLLDGLNFGRIPLNSLADKSVIQSVHDYDPIQVTHYKAPWLANIGSTTWPVPQWPPFMAPRDIWGPMHTNVADAGPGQDYCQQTADGLCSPLTINGDFPAGTTIAVNINQVSFADESNSSLWSTHLVMVADSQTPPILEQDYSVASVHPASSSDNAQWNVYQPVIDQNYQVRLDSDAHSVSLQVTEGDWVTLGEIVFTLPTDAGPNVVRLVPMIQRWDVPQTTYTLDSDGRIALAGSPPVGYENDFNPLGWLDDWKALKDNGYDVMVGEFGVYNQTSQAVTLAWMSDQLAAFRRCGVSGWATWTPFGEFGIMGAPRPGESAEQYAGHPLNREMLNLVLSH
jgi:aryl-phospho-beta-D-glucosidase BglC (GH1 family)